MKRALFILVLAFATCLAPDRGAVAQSAPPVSGVDRIRAAAVRVGLSSDQIAPALAGLSRLEADGLPTGRYTDRIVEFIAKRGGPEMLAARSRKLEQETRSAKEILADPSVSELSSPDQAPSGWDPIEDLADALQSSPMSPEDLLDVGKNLNSESLPRILAGADALAHVRRMGLEDELARRLLSSARQLAEAEIRAFPSALFTGRRCGMEDGEIVQEVIKQVEKGKTPSEIAKKWSQSPSYRGRGNRNPNCTPGSGEGNGPGWRGGRGQEGGARGSGMGGGRRGRG